MNSGEKALCVVMTNGGGEGKTVWAEALTCLAEIAHLNPLVLDIDQGNRGFRNRNGFGSAEEWRWDRPNIAPDQAHQWVRDKFASHDVIIADTGANFVTASPEASASLSALVEAAKSLGQRAIFYAVTSPNKAGSGSLVESIYERFGKVVDVVVVRSNRDGSGAFKAGLDALGAPVIDIGHLEPGIQSYRLTRHENLSEVIRKPTPDFDIASGMLAAWLKQLAQNEHIRSLIGDRADDELAKLAAAAPGPTMWVLSQLRQVRNADLQANVRARRAYGQFCNELPSNENAFSACAKELWDAVRAYNAVA